MALYVIGDTHFSEGCEKPMDVFGGRWIGYRDKLIQGLSVLQEEDTLVLCGDFSWGMSLQEALPDFRLLDSFPGRKLLLKGNHDYWWQGITKIREALPKNIHALQNDSVKIGNVVFCGSRGWAVEGSPDFDEHDRHIYEREVERFKLALNSAKKLMEEGDKLVCLIHYPPFNVRKEASLFTKLFESYNVDKVVYGHLHGKGVVPYRNLSINGVEYILSSCDLVDNKLVEVF